MQVLEESLSQRITVAAERPVLRAGDVFLFGFIQLAAVGDMRRNQIARFLQRQRGSGIVRLIELVARG